MNDRTKVINGVTVRDITPELTGEERKERINTLVASLLQFNKNRKKDKTA